MKKLGHIIRLAFVLILSICSTALKEIDPTDSRSISREIERRLSAMNFVAPSGNPFTEIASLTGVNWGDMTWGDYDGDGDYDVVVTGNSGIWTSSILFTKLYKNTGGVFTEDTNNSLVPLVDSSCDWGDYDNDGDIDLLMTGYSNTTVLAAATVIYNNANGILTKISTPDINAAGFSRCSWVDVDGDGDLDATVMGLFVTPPNAVGDLGTLLRNDGNNVFTRSFNFLGADQGDAVWADFDNDKDMDVLVTGGFNNTTLNINNVTSNFSVSSLNGLTFSGAVWGDFDSDGDPDLIVTGTKYDSNVGTIDLYKNDGSGHLTSVGTAGITAHYEASITAGDYDNDGDLDLVLTGFTAPTSSVNTDLYKNDGTGNFTQVSNPGFSPIRAGEAKWADFDNDGDLDLIIGGGTDHDLDGIVKIYRNDLNPANTKPNTPTGLALTQSGTSLNFSWNTTTDAQGGKVTYNLRVGTTPGGSEIMATSSNLSTGYHRIATPGNVQGTTSWKIQNNTASKIYWSVQAIDNSLLGGNFATEASLDHQLPMTNFAAGSGNQKVELSWTNPNSSGHAVIYRETTPTTSPTNIIASSVTQTTYTDNTVVNGTTYYYYILSADNSSNSSTLVSVSAVPAIFTEMQSLAGIGGTQGRNLWGDYDQDGDYDILISGASVAGSPITKMYTNTNGTFAEATSLTLAAVPYSWVSWNDYDNDNDLDILITQSSLPYASYLYQNTNGVFTDVTAATKLLPAGGFHGWADWDNDGDVDLAVAQSNSSFTARNDRPEGFSPAFTLEGGAYIHWADYDNDGDLDFIMEGQANSYIIFNNNKGVFTSAFNLPTSIAFDCAWADVDNDGDLDVITSGHYSDGYIKVYKNTGSGFSLSGTVGSSGLMFTTLAVGDYDNDGDADLSFTAISYDTFNAIIKIFSNDGTGNYSEVLGTQLDQAAESTSAWCDYDHDGDLDLLVSGQKDDNSIITKVYRNNLNPSNTPPTVPSNLQASVGNASATFTWNAATDAQGGPITYNLRVGITPGGSEILSPMANVNTGTLLTPGMGNVQLNRSWKLNIPPGTYYWSVQAIDGAFASSNFAGEQQLVVDYPTSIAIADQTMTYGDTKSIDLSTIFSNASTYTATTDITTIANATIQGSLLNISTLHSGTVLITVIATAESGGTGSQSFSLTVNKASLQITADDNTMVYHGVAPTFTYKVTGLKLSETETVISPAITVTGPDITSNVGSYPLTVHAGTAENYTITTTNGTLTITRASGQITLTNLQKTFNGSAQIPTVAVVPSGLEVDLTYDGATTAPSQVGSYQVAATINDINYQGSATGTMVISAITGVEDTRREVSIYPNPVKDELFVKASGLEKGRLSITDMLGQEIKSQSIENEMATIDCRSFATGMFVVIVYDESNHKVIITKAIKM